MYRVGLIGYGYWGPNLARVFSRHSQAKLLRIVDTDSDRAKKAALEYPLCTVTQNVFDVTRATDIDLVVIATPVFTHYELTADCLNHGKHVWVEKPLASSSADGKRLLDLAESKKLTVMVDHTFLFHPAVLEIKAMLEKNLLGRIYYYDSTRVNLGLFQHDVSVIWDLAPHDLSILGFLFGHKVRAVSAQGGNYFGKNLAEVAYVTLHYDDNMLAHLHLNWLSPVKIRQTLIGGSRSMLVWNDILQDENLKIYDRGVDLKTAEGRHASLASYRNGPMFAPILPRHEPLGKAVDHMIQSLEKKTEPICSARAGIKILEILEACDRSLELNGNIVSLE
jgi:predicted dehydrogenase